MWNAQPFAAFQLLWYLFESELDIVAKECIPDVRKILATSIQEKVSSRLGERGCDMLVNYMEVNQILKEELAIALNNGSHGSYLGKLKEWTNNLPSKVLSASSDTFTSIAKAAFHHSSDIIANKGSGRCQCGGVKVLKVNWKSGCDSLPSFFGGCARYRSVEKFQHDRAVPFRSATVSSILSESQYVVKVADADLQHLLRLLEDEEKYHRESPISEEVSARFAKVYGRPSDGQPLADIIRSHVDQVSSIIKKRKEKSHVYGTDVRVSACTNDTPSDNDDD